MTKPDLTGRTALVTGGAKRLGAATALALADAGANVVIHYGRSAAEAEALVERLTGSGVEAWAVQADLAKEEDRESLVARACQMAGPLQILVNNASVFPASEFDTFDLDDLRDTLEVNTWAPFAIARHFAETMDSGHIVNFLDTKVAGYDWSHVAYHASKTLLELFTRMMAIRFAPGFAVNAVAPGLILPPEGKDESYLESLSSDLPLKRVGNPREVTDAVLFLVTSSFITGQIVFVDGGRHLRGPDLG